MKLSVQIVDDAGNVYTGETHLQLTAGNGSVQNRPTVPPKKASNKTVKCPSAIERLWRAEKFKQSQSLTAIQATLALEGFNFPSNTVMMALQNAEFLTRRGERGNYAWSQKYPFNH